MSTTWLTVHVRINDSASGKPTPVRVRFQSQGRVIAPLGRFTDFPRAPGAGVGGHLAVGAEEHVYVDGACEIRLPPGEVTIDASKGPEYSPLHAVVNLAPGQMSIRLSIHRWTDLRKRRWFSGDSHVLFLEPHAAQLEGMAEDLSVVQLLAFEQRGDADDCRIAPNLLAFQGAEPVLVRDDHCVAVGTRNTHPRLGTLSLLQAHRVVHPLRFGDPDGLDDWSLADWCEQCHRKNGLVVWTDLRLPRLESEALADLILGQVDAFEIVHFSSTDPEAIGEWYQLLCTGLRAPLVGGSGKDGNTIAVGAVRTYALLAAEQSATYTNWIEAVRAGRTFVTNGPIVLLSVDEQPPGATLSAAIGQSVRIRAEVSSQCPVDCLEIVVNGEIIDVKEPSGDRLAGELELDWVVEGGCWIAARCWSDEPLVDGQRTYAHTSPVYVEVDGAGVAPDPTVVERLRQHLRQTLSWTREQARCENERQRARLEGIFTAALDKLPGPIRKA